MLAEIYHWLTEGFDTADLRDAKALLHELGNYRSSTSQIRLLRSLPKVERFLVGDIVRPTKELGDTYD